MGGLTTAYCLAKAGHKVTILEAATTIGELGTDIQLSPNISACSPAHPLRSRKYFTVKPETLTFPLFFQVARCFIVDSGCTGETLGWIPSGETMQKNYGAPYYQIHVELSFDYICIVY